MMKFCKVLNITTMTTSTNKTEAADVGQAKKWKKKTNWNWTSTCRSILTLFVVALFLFTGFVLVSLLHQQSSVAKCRGNNNNMIGNDKKIVPMLENNHEEAMVATGSARSLVQMTADKKESLLQQQDNTTVNMLREQLANVSAQNRLLQDAVAGHATVVQLIQSENRHQMTIFQMSARMSEVLNENERLHAEVARLEAASAGQKEASDMELAKAHELMSAHTELISAHAENMHLHEKVTRLEATLTERKEEAAAVGSRVAAEKNLMHRFLMPVVDLPASVVGDEPTLELVAETASSGRSPSSSTPEPEQEEHKKRLANGGGGSVTLCEHTCDLLQCDQILVSGKELVLSQPPDDPGRCIELPPDWQNVVSSVQLSSSTLCVELFASARCLRVEQPYTPASVIIRPNTEWANNFGKLHFNDLAQSVRFC